MPVAQGDQNKPEAVQGSAAQGTKDQPTTAAGRLAQKRAAKAAEKAKKRATEPVSPEITAGVAAAKGWYDSHGRTVWFGLFAFVAAGIGIVGVSSYMAGEHAAVAGLLDGAVSAANAPLIAEGEDVPEGVDESFPTEKARAQKMLEEANKAVKASKGETALWAALAQGNALAQLDKRDEAKKAYERVLSAGDAAPSFLRYRALEGLGFALEGDKKYGEAAARFEQLSALEGGAYKVVGEYQRARMLIAQGDRKKASEVLDALLKAERSRPATEAKRFEDVVSSAETLLNELSVELDDPKLRADAPGKAAAHGNNSADIMEMIRSQLKAGKGEPKLDDEQLKQLERQLDRPSAPAGAPTAPAAPPEGATK